MGCGPTRRGPRLSSRSSDRRSRAPGRCILRRPERRCRARRAGRVRDREPSRRGRGDSCGATPPPRCALVRRAGLAPRARPDPRGERDPGLGRSVVRSRLPVGLRFSLQTQRPCWPVNEDSKPSDRRCIPARCVADMPVLRAARAVRHSWLRLRGVRRSNTPGILRSSRLADRGASTP